MGGMALGCHYLRDHPARFPSWHCTACSKHFTTRADTYTLTVRCTLHCYAHVRTHYAYAFEGAPSAVPLRLEIILHMKDDDAVCAWTQVAAGTAHTPAGGLSKPRM